MKTLIENGLLERDGRIEKTSLMIDTGKIVALGENLGPADQTVDASGCFVLPGFIDFHTHIGDRIGRFDLADNYESGTRLAIENGVTTVCTFVTQGSGAPLSHALARAHERSRGHSFSDVAWHLTPTRFEPSDWQDMETCVAAGYRTFKFYTTYRSAGLYLDSERLEELFHRLKPLGVRFLLHCEDDDLLSAVNTEGLDLKRASAHARLRPEEAEVASVEHVLQLASRHAAPVHFVHISTSEAATRISRARWTQDVTSETCPQYLWLDESWLDRPDGHRWICSPPLRKGRNHFRQLARECAFDLFGTDHCAFSREDKDVWDGTDIRTVANGLAGIGALPHLVWKLWEDDPKAAALELTQRLSKAPANRLGYAHRKGALTPGHDADVVILDPGGPERPIISSLANVYETYPGFTSRLHFRHVFLRGEAAVENGQILPDKKPAGQPLQPLPEVFASKN